ncbi:MAG TPA: hypothetical protein VEW66_08275 [Thermomicrobiales bacterium]|nr:hypothetical protein [Thermomicrobiales bacterium]
MRSPLKLTALLALVMFAFSLVGGTGVGAQDDTEESLQPSDLDGIQYGVSRSWSMDYEAMYADSTPGDDMATPEGVLFIAGLVIEFDDDGNAEAGFDAFMDDFDTEELATSDEATVEEWDIELGNQSASYSSLEEVEGVESEVVVSVVQEDNYLYVISAAGSGEDMKAPAKSLIETMIDNDGSGEGEFNADGTSSGGLWDKLPAADDEAVADLIATDEMIYPEPEDDDAS